MQHGERLTIDEAREVWSMLVSHERAEAFRALTPTMAEEFFFELSTGEQAALIEALQPSERRLWLRLLAPDDLADVVQSLDEEHREPVLALLDEATRNEARALLAYREDVAGGLMSPRFARLRPDVTVEAAISYLRKQATGGNVETIYDAYVLDSAQRLLGVVSLRDLFRAGSGQIVKDVMRTEVVVAHESLDEEAVARLFESGLLAVPVVDGERHMKGIVTVDDIVDVVRDVATEDIQKVGGAEALEAPYFDTGFLTMVRKRGGWLTILFVSEMLTATAMGYFEDEIARAVVLALFLPLIISSGGNSGSQASTLMVRSLALGEVRLSEWRRVLRRELAAGLTLGVLLGLVGLLRVALWGIAFKSYGPHFVLIACTVAASLVGVVTWGTVSGSMLPFALRRLGFDPASASAPFVATLIDVTGLVIYFSVAALLLRGVLL
jgi:magnesium transporter